MTKVVFYDVVLNDLLKDPSGAVGRYLKNKGNEI